MGSEPEAGAPAEQPLRELLHQAAQGDPVATNRLLAEIEPYLRAEVQCRADGQPVDASGVVQECLLAVWKNAHAVHGTTDAQVRAWLRTIAKNEVLDALGRLRPQVPLPQDSGGGVTVAADTPTPSQELTRREDEYGREEALRRLSSNDQKVLQLRFHEGHDWPEIAQMMQRTEKAVMRLYYRAVKRWKQETGDEQ